MSPFAPRKCVLSRSERGQYALLDPLRDVLFQFAEEGAAREAEETGGFGLVAAAVGQCGEQTVAFGSVVGGGGVGSAVRFADSSGERELPIPADLELPAPPPLTDDPRNRRSDWQAMAHVEIAPYTELCKSLKAAILGQPAPSPVPVATFADGLANMQVMDAIGTSARNGGALVRVEAM